MSLITVRPQMLTTLAAQRRRTSNQVIPDQTVTAIDWQVTDVDTGGWFTGIGSELQVPPGVGWIMAAGGIALVAAGNVGEIILRLHRNGAHFAGGPSFRIPGGPGTRSLAVCSGPIPVAAGDVFELACWHSTGATADVVAAFEGTYFSIIAIG